MIDIMIAMAELLGGQYEIWPDGTIQAFNWLGEIAGCGSLTDSDDRFSCVLATSEVWS